MTIPTQQNPMKLHRWEQLLYDSAVQKGRYERGIEILGAILPVVEKMMSLSQGIIVPDREEFKDILYLIKELHDNIMRQQGEINVGCGHTSDQLLIQAKTERDEFELYRSRFTARSIAAIMEVTAGDRG